jgi:hypothetical protein
MNQIRRRASAAANPVSTAATRWWCHSALRHMLTGYGPTARQGRLIRHQTQGGRFESSAGQRAERMKGRAKAIDDLLGRDDRRDTDQIR